MKRKEAIADLIAKVEAGKFNATISAAEGIWGTYHRNANFVSASYRGSLDAAKALHEAVIGPMPTRMHSDARKQLLDTLTLLHAQQGD